MTNLLETIRDELKGVHIETGRTDSFDKVCQDLANRLSNSTVFEYGFRKGQEDLRDSFKALLDIEECSCDD